MKKNRFFIDTLFVQALLNKRDQYHSRAVSLFPRMRQASEVVITEVVLIEIADSLCSLALREDAAAWIEAAYGSRNISVVGLGDTPFRQGLELYKSRKDKTWSLTDCLSFEVMRERGLTEALTADRHFSQAGFRALLLDESKDDDNIGA